MTLGSRDATTKLLALWAILWDPWGKNDEEFLRATTELEMAMIRLEHRRTWARPSRPIWQSRFLSSLIGLAQRNDLLDLEMEEEFDPD